MAFIDERTRREWRRSAGGDEGSCDEHLGENIAQKDVELHPMRLDYIRSTSRGLNNKLLATVQCMLAEEDAYSLSISSRNNTIHSHPQRSKIVQSNRGVVALGVPSAIPPCSLPTLLFAVQSIGVPSRHSHSRPPSLSRMQFADRR